LCHAVPDGFRVTCCLYSEVQQIHKPISAGHLLSGEIILVRARQSTTSCSMYA
jgi:hypothetical protein